MKEYISPELKLKQIDIDDILIVSDDGFIDFDQFDEEF
jgi:hypothetical protein